REAEARAESARERIAVLEEQLRQNQLQMEQAKIDAEGRVRQAESELEAAKSDLAQQEAAYQFALFDAVAYDRLARSGAVSERRGREATTNADERAAAVAAAKRRGAAARGGVAAAPTDLVKPPVRGAAASGGRGQINHQQAEVAPPDASAERARAQPREAEANRRDLIVPAPFDGTVTTRSAEPGEVLESGTPVVTLLDLTKVYLRGFIPGGEIGKVKVGQPARVF